MPLLIAAGIIGPGLAAPEAKADITSDAFVMALDSEGITYSSKPAVINAGKAICNILDTGANHVRSINPRTRQLQPEPLRRRLFRGCRNRIILP
ncbi:hypothetical protein PBI_IRISHSHERPFALK_57 [Mycobacterium phage IrishSherpFalk]|nr:hypothetical protein PBI_IRISHSHERPFALK_57 [Mycobacterium phage IrishSherpFalk]